MTRVSDEEAAMLHAIVTYDEIAGRLGIEGRQCKTCHFAMKPGPKTGFGYPIGPMLCWRFPPAAKEFPEVLPSQFCGEWVQGAEGRWPIDPVMTHEEVSEAIAQREARK